MNQSATDALTQRYRASLPEKQSELALAWEQWLAAPGEQAAKLRFQGLVHKLAGSAGLYGFEDLGRQARSVDSSLAAWEEETPPLRRPLEEFCREVAGSAEMLLRVLGRAARAPSSLPAKGVGSDSKRRSGFFWKTKKKRGKTGKSHPRTTCCFESAFWQIDRSHPACAPR